MSIKFSDFPYYPALRTRPAELTGYSKLNSNIKNNLVPIMRLGSWPRCADLSESIAQLTDAIEDNNFIVDITREAMYQNPSVHALLDPSDDFKAWRNTAKSIS
jgi:hypothetical protein